MKLAPSYESMSAVPQGYEGAFTEQEGKAVFTGGEFDFKSEADVLAMETAKGHVKTELAEAKEKLKAFDGIDPTKQKGMLDELDVLRVKVKDGTGSEDEIAIREAARVRDREADTAKIQELSGLLDEANGFKTKTQKDSLLNGHLSKHVSEGAMSDARFIMDSATDFIDGKLLSNGNAGFEKGLDFEALTSKAMETRTHWQKSSQGGGAQGGGDAQPKEGRAKFDELMKKRTGGETLNRQESIELSTLANQLKNEE